MSAARTEARLLQFDLGNSQVKWRCTAGLQVISRGRGPDINSTQPDWRELRPTPDMVQVASVASDELEQRLEAEVRHCFVMAPWFARSAAAAGRLRNGYSEPARMGVDRWLAMLAVSNRCSTRFCVVDAGSALTIDLVSEQGAHEGGYILPGATLMERALLLDTQRVRFEQSGAAESGPGRSTASCVRNGIALAQAGAVRLALDRAGMPKPALYLCGGGSSALLPLFALEQPQLEPDLVFDGLAQLARIECAV